MLQLHINNLYTFFPSSFIYYTLVKKSKGTSNFKCGLQNRSKLCPAFLNVFFCLFVCFFFALENSPAKSKKNYMTTLFTVLRQNM